MNHFFKTFSTIFFVLAYHLTTAQIQISFPTTRAVLQRNNANEATIRITGYYTSAVTRIEARLQARDGQGTSTDWSTLQNNPSGGIYAGDLKGKGGWYNLDVRGMNGDQQVGNVTTVERVGIGEVFIIAGQSNSQGIHQSAPNPQNDRVNCVNYRYPDDGFPNEPPTPVFTLLDNFDGFHIAPRGLGSWCWGQLGDLLVKRLNVPVMFFNAGFMGTSISNWRESAPEGGVAYSVYNGQPYIGRQPYINLKLSLQFYANMLGVRAVLWDQGEADNYSNTSASSYASDLLFLMNQARRDFNQNMPWMVARASYGDFQGGVDENIIAGQNLAITMGTNVFPGPSTDGIQIPRQRPPLYDIDGVHFDFSGLLEVATAWNNSLSDSFFQTSNPIGPALSPTMSIECAGNSLKISVNGNYPTVQWESGESGSSITKGPGIYRAKIKDALGNTFFSSQVRVSDSPVASIVDNRPPSICVGSNLSLTTNYDNVTWINQQNNTTASTSRTFSTVTAGAYYVRYRDVSGCDFSSNTLNVSVNPLPATPTIANDKPTTFCQGDNTTLRASSDNVQYNWSDGQKNKTVSVGNSGSYFLTVTNQSGCTSAQSNTIVVTANPAPAKPVISANGPAVFCADRNITLTATQNAAYQWTSGQTSQAITLNQSGNFAVRTRNEFGCLSEQSDAITIKANPLPQTPSVSAVGTTTFCAGNSVVLNATSSADVVWSSGQTNKSITISSSGNYAVQARDQNSCVSGFSTVIAVKVNPLPATPTILASPSPIICAGDKVTLRVDGPYTVFWNTGDSTQSITRSTAGTYSARVRDANGCTSAQMGSTTVELRPLPPSPTVNIIGTYTLEAVSSTNGTQFRWRRDNDSLTVQTATIKVSDSGIYTARSSIVYSQSLTCFSLPSAPVSFSISPDDQGLSIYPNPNPDKVLTIETRDNLTNAVLTVYTLNGQPILTTPVALFDDRKRLSLTGTPSGMYIIRVQAAGFDVAKRILVGL